MKMRQVYGSLQDGLAKLAKMPMLLQTRVTEARCFLNLNEIWDYYQARGLSATIAAIDNDERNALADRFTDDKQVYQCGHQHENYREAQLCHKWRLIALGDAPMATKN